MQDETQRWIQAAKTLADDPSAKVPCPRCSAESLQVEDVPNPADPEVMERILRCPRCGAMNALRLRRPR
jgi:uncharacterized C2H2 Zn-finger protein